MNNNLGPRYQVENHRLPFARSSSSGSSNGNPKPPAVPAANDDDAWSAWLAQTAKNAAAKTAAKTVHVRDHVVDRLPRERLLHTNHHEGGGLEKSGDHGHGPRQSFHPEKHNVLDHTDLLDAPPTIAHIEGGSSTLSGDWQDHDGHLGQRIPKKTFSRPMSQQHHDGDQQQHPTPHWRREVSSPASGPSTRYDVADEQSGTRTSPCVKYRRVIPMYDPSLLSMASNGVSLPAVAPRIAGMSCVPRSTPILAINYEHHPRSVHWCLSRYFDLANSRKVNY